jgi:hypothetical protein
MTKQAFLIHAHFLVDELREYRRSLPLEIADQRFLLVLDGHSSRFTVEAIGFLAGQGVDVLILPPHCTHVLQAFDVCLASPFKTRLAQLCDDADLTLTETAVFQLSESLSASQCLGEKRRLLFQAFLWAWNESASRRNIASAFEKVGMVPLNPQKPLENPATRHNRAGDPFPDPLDSPDMMSSTLITSPEKLSVLAAKPQRMFIAAEPVTDEKAQWTRIICGPNSQGRFLAAPSGFLWRKKVNSGSRAGNSPRIMAYKWNGFDPVFMWIAMVHLAPNLPKLMCCGSVKQCTAMMQHLQAMEVPCTCVHRNRSQGMCLKAWNPFILGQSRACVGTESSLLGLQTLEPVLKAYTEFPVNHDIERHHGDVLYLFSDERELEILRRIQISPEVVG